MGIKVFDRKTKPVSVTKEGMLIIRQLKVIAQEIRVLEEEVQSLKGELSGTLRIGIIPTIAPYILPIFFNDFAKKFPKITFSISEITTNTIVELLRKRELDIGILALPLGLNDLKEIALYNEPFMLFDCSKEKKISEGYASLEDIDSNKFWLLEEGHCMDTQVKSLCDYESCQHKEHINFDFKTGSIESLIRFVKVNQGITILPYLASLEFAPSERNRLMKLKPPVPVRTIGLVVHRHYVKHQILNHLQQEIQEKIAPLLEKEALSYVVSPL